MRAFIALIVSMIAALPMGAQVFCGQILKTTDSSGLASAQVYLDGEKFHAQSTDKDGKFYFYQLSKGTHTIRVAYGGYTDTTYTVSWDSTIRPTFVFYYAFACAYDQSGVKHACPVCSTMDEVIPISYGLPTKAGMGRAERGEIYLGGCVVTHCDQQWHCKRCKKEF